MVNLLYRYLQKINLPNPELIPSCEIADDLLSKGVTSLYQAIEYIHQLPYCRISDNINYHLVLKEQRGTCTPKHALIAELTSSLHIPLNLKAGIILMNADNAPKIAPVLKKYVTPQVLQQLKGLTSKLQTQCDALDSLEIPETLVQADFHSNNIVIDPKTKKLCYLDLGEVVIAHPFFSMINFLLQAIKHHGLKKEDEHYLKLIEICERYWPNFQKILPKAETIFPIYSALGCYRLMKSIDINAYYQFYGNRHKLGDNLREYLDAR